MKVTLVLVVAALTSGFYIFSQMDDAPGEMDRAEVCSSCLLENVREVRIEIPGHQELKFHRLDGLWTMLRPIRGTANFSQLLYLQNQLTKDFYFRKVAVENQVFDSLEYTLYWGAKKKFELAKKVTVDGRSFLRNELGETFVVSEAWRNSVFTNPFAWMSRYVFSFKNYYEIIIFDGGHEVALTLPQDKWEVNGKPARREQVEKYIGGLKEFQSQKKEYYKPSKKWSTFLRLNGKSVKYLKSEDLFYMWVEGEKIQHVVKAEDFKRMHWNEAAFMVKSK